MAGADTKGDGVEAPARHPSMDVALIGPDDPRWRAELSSVPHEFYHLPEYVALEAERMGGEAVSLLVTSQSGSLMLPLVLREMAMVTEKGNDLIFRDAVSPYGYPGPLLHTTNGRDPSLFVKEALATATPFLREKRIVCAFVRMNPLLNTPSAYTAVGSLVESGSVVWLDLALSVEDLNRGMRSRFRSYINATVRAGVTVRFDRDFQYLDDFIRIYHLSMDRVRAADWYYFNRPYFDALNNMLGDNLKLCVIEKGTAIVAAGLFAVSNGIVQYLLSGTDVDAGVDHATKLMMVYVRDWAKAAGNAKFHLGGGLGGDNDNLSRFKRGFSKLTQPFYTWRMVFDETIYESAVAAWEHKNSEVLDADEDYFPAYRKTLPI